MNHVYVLFCVNCFMFTLLSISFPLRQQINKYAFSGGQNTREEHEMYGGNCDVDVSYQYLKYFLDDDEKLADIHRVSCSCRFRNDFMSLIQMFYSFRSLFMISNTIQFTVTS